MSWCCENPFNLDGHTEKWYSFVSVKQADSTFVDTYSACIPSLKVGMKICVRCRNRIETQTLKNIHCGNPLQIEGHYGEFSFFVTNEIKLKFFSTNCKWENGTAVCTKCALKLHRLQGKFNKKYGESNIDLCCNPFNLSPHPSGKSNREITEAMTELYGYLSENLVVGKKICNACKTKLYRKKSALNKTKTVNEQPVNRFSRFIDSFKRRSRYVHHVENVCINTYMILYRVYKL